MRTSAAILLGAGFHVSVISPKLLNLASLNGLCKENAVSQPCFLGTLGRQEPDGYRELLRWCGIELTCCRKNVGHGSVTLANADKATQQPSSLSSWHQLTAPQSRLLGGEFILQTAAIESCRAGTALGYTDVPRVRDIKIIKWYKVIGYRFQKVEKRFSLLDLRVKAGIFFYLPARCLLRNLLGWLAILIQSHPATWI